jgi:hypothetical protein
MEVGRVEQTAPVEPRVLRVAIQSTGCTGQRQRLQMSNRGQGGGNGGDLPTAAVLPVATRESG